VTSKNELRRRTKRASVCYVNAVSYTALGALSKGTKLKNLLFLDNYYEFILQIRDKERVCSVDRASQYIGTVTDRASQYIGTVTDRAPQYIGTVTDRASQYIGTVTDRALQYINIMTPT
jgi:hypothetical protein